MSRARLLPLCLLLACGPERSAPELPAGLWHLDVHLQGLPPQPAALRLSGEAGAPRAVLAGRPAAVARASAESLFLIGVEYQQGATRISRSLDLRERPGPDEIRGLAWYCARASMSTAQPGPESCARGPFTGRRMAARPGEAPAQGVVLLGEAGDFPAAEARSITTNVRVRGRYAYLSRYTDGLRVVDIADPRRPQVVAHLPAPDGASGEIYNDIKLYKDYALLASSRHGMVMVDISDPLHPRRARSFPLQDGVNVHSIQVEGERAYLADLSISGLRVVSLADPEAPVEVGTFVHEDARARPPRGDSFTHDLSVSGGVAFLNYWGTGFVAVDVRQAPFTQIGRATYDRMTSHASAVTEVLGRRFAVHGDEDYGAHLRVFDVTDPQDAGTWMKQVGAFALRPEVSIHNIEAVGDLIYAAYYQDGLRVLRLDAQGRPTQVAHYNTWDLGRHPGESFYEGAIGLQVEPAARRIYVADTARGLLILEQ